METLPATFFPTVFSLWDLDFEERRKGDVGASVFQASLPAGRAPAGPEVV